MNNNPVNGNDPTGLADWLKAGRSFVDMLSNGAGVVTGGVLTVTGAGLLLAPEPTGITKAGGAFTLTTGLAGIANSGTGLVNSTRNLVRALQDNPAKPGNLPTSGFGVIADTFFPGSQTAQDFATVGDLSLALLSGRVPVGTAQINTFSALSQRVPVGINGMFDAGAVAVPKGMGGLLQASADSTRSFASLALDGTQLGQLGTIAYDQASNYLGNSGSAAAGGFLLYPNKSNTNQLQSVYSK